MEQISSVIEAYQTCYNSIELITLAFKKDDVWFNIISVLYCLDEVINDYKEILLYDKHNIKLVKQKIMFKEINNIFENFKNGYIKTSEFKIRLREAFDPDGCTINNFSSKEIREMNDAEIFYVSRSMQKERDILEIMTDDSIRMGYKNSYEYISEKIGIKNFNENNSNDIYIILPIYIKIKTKEIKNKKLILNISHNKNINDIQINIESYRNDYYNKVIYRDNNILELNNEVIFDLNNIQPSDRINMYIFSQKIPRLQILDHIDVPIEKPLIPLSIVFNQFYSLEEFEKTLLGPEKLKRKNISGLFEKAVYYLFSLCGFSVIHLGKEHEKIVLKSKTEIGSADIIAYDGSGNILLIDCTINNPDIKKMSNLNRIKGYFDDFPELDNIVNIISVIVTPVKYEKYENEYGIIIIDKMRISELLNMIYFKDKKDIIDKIIFNYGIPLLPS
jgi:hypothetical protein